MKKILPFLVFTIFGISLIGQSSNWVRTVVWVYGLGGDPMITWSKADEFSQNDWNVFGLKPTYGDLGLESAGEDLNTFLANNQGDFYGTKQPYIIAHSMGGLVSRASEKLYFDDPNLDNPYGGIVTFGSPHKGAEILDNIEELKGLLNEMCILFGPYIALKYSGLKYLIDVFPRKQQSLAEETCPDAVDLAFMNLADEYLAPITQDLTPSNEEGYLNTELNNFNGDPAIRSRAFYGVELDNEVYRFAKWFVNSPEAEDFGEATEDQDYVRLYQGFYNEFRAKQQYHEDGSFLLCRINFLCRQNKARDRASINQRRAGFLRGLNYKWLNVVGGRELMPLIVKRMCRCEDDQVSFYWPIEYEVNDPSECDPGCEYFEIKESRSVFVDNTDGLVTQTSAEGQPWSERQIEMDGSSHFQMRNDENTERELNLLYDGEYGSFFEL